VDTSLLRRSQEAADLADVVRELRDDQRADDGARELVVGLVVVGAERREETERSDPEIAPTLPSQL
jgi:hypothetical protein